VITDSTALLAANPHIVLQLRHVLLGCGFLRERPRQHELGLEHGIAALNPAIQRGPHPAQRGVTDFFLDIADHLAAIGLVPAAIKVLGGDPELDHEIARQVLWLDFPALLPPQSDERLLITAHNDPGVGAADEGAPPANGSFPHGIFHVLAPAV
jgi:hypothetical protein